MKPDEIIAKYMWLKCQTFNFDLSAPRVYKDDTWRKCEYSTSIEWLYPVYLKLRKELNDLLNTEEITGGDLYYEVLITRDKIQGALIQGDIQELHSEIVKGITFLTEQKK